MPSMATATLALFLLLSSTASVPSADSSVRQAKATSTLLVLNKAENTVWLVDMATGEPRAKLPTGPQPNEVAVSPNQKVAAISDMGGAGVPLGKTMTFVDIAAGKVTQTIDLSPHGAAHGIVWLSNDRLLFTSHMTDSVVELDVKAGKVVRAIPTEQKGTHLAVVARDQSRAWAVNAVTGSVTEIDLKAGRVVRQIPTGARAEGISLSPDGKWVACGNIGADTVSIIEAETGKVVHTLAGTGMPIRTLFTANGKHLAVSCVKSGTLQVFSVEGWKKVAEVELKGAPAIPDYGNQWPVPMNLSLLPNGNLLVVLVTSHAVAEVDTKTWKAVRYFSTGRLPDGIAVAGLRDQA